MRLDELTLELPADKEAVRLLSRALGNVEGKKIEIEQKTEQEIKQERGQWIVRITNIVLLAVLVLFLLSIPPSESLFKRVKKGPFRLLVKVVIFAILYWFLVVLLLR